MLVNEHCETDTDLRSICDAYKYKKNYNNEAYIICYLRGLSMCDYVSVTCVGIFSELDKYDK